MVELARVVRLWDFGMVPCPTPRADPSSPGEGEPIVDLVRLECLGKEVSGGDVQGAG